MRLNTALEYMLDIKRDEALGQHVQDLFSEDFAETLWQVPCRAVEADRNSEYLQNPHGHESRANSGVEHRNSPSGIRWNRPARWLSLRM